MTSFFTFIGHQRKTLSKAYRLSYLMQDHQTRRGSTSWDGTMLCAITDDVRLETSRRHVLLCNILLSCFNEGMIWGGGER